MNGQADVANPFLMDDGWSRRARGGTSVLQFPILEGYSGSLIRPLMPTLSSFPVSKSESPDQWMEKAARGEH